MPNAYPLSWPEGWPRTAQYRRREARFRSGARGEVSIADAVARTVTELERLGVHFDSVIVSTNVQPRLDGFPRTGERKPDDPGVAVYWTDKAKRSRVIAIDHYDAVAGNLAAIAATLEALRAIERHGGAQILERAFTGFTALPAPGSSAHWRDVLQFPAGATVSIPMIDSRYRSLASSRHPDKGGTHEAMAELNRARDEAAREVSAA